MRITRATIAALTLFSITGFSAQSVQAQSEEACREEFIAVYTQAEGFTYPYSATIETQMGRLSSSMIRTHLSPSHFIDSHGTTLYQTDGLERSESTDNGATWTNTERLNGDQLKTEFQERSDTASTASDTVCTDDVERNGKTYRLVEGTVRIGDSTISSQRFYRAASGDVMVRESDLTISDTEATIVTQVTGTGDSVIIPSHYQ